MTKHIPSEWVTGKKKSLNVAFDLGLRGPVTNLYVFKNKNKIVSFFNVVGCQILMRISDQIIFKELKVEREDILKDQQWVRPLSRNKR